jgi:dienelactone hydrolase
MPREHVSFPSGDDWCAAYVYRPDGTGAGDGDGGAHPCVVMAHGFSATRDDALPAYAERFAAAGLVVVLFDYRHFGRSTGEPRQLLDIGRQLDDYRAALRFARALPGVDPERVALWGTSFSGGHVLTIGAEDHGVAAVVAQVPFCDGIPTLLTVPPRNALRGTAYAVVDRALALLGAGPLTIPAVGPPGSFAVMTAPEAEPGFAALLGPQSRWRNAVAARIMLHVATYRPGTKADRITCPLLVCVADDDETTPPGPAVAAAERAPRGELHRYAMGHFDAYAGDFERVVADQTRFLARHLLRAAEPVATAA